MGPRVRGSGVLKDGLATARERNFPLAAKNLVCVRPPEPVSLNPVLRCIECGAETDRFEPGWRTLLSFDPEQDSFHEAVSYCPECSVREFEFPSRVSPRD